MFVRGAGGCQISRIKISWIGVPFGTRADGKTFFLKKKVTRATLPFATRINRYSRRWPRLKNGFKAEAQ